MPTLSRKSLLELLYSPIISAIGNVVDFMVGTSELTDKEFMKDYCNGTKSPSKLMGSRFCERT